MAARLGEPVNHKRVTDLARQPLGWCVSCLGTGLVECNGSCRSAPASSGARKAFGVLQAVSTDFTELPYAAGSRKAWLIVIHDLVSRWVVAVGRRRNRELALEIKPVGD